MSARGASGSSEWRAHGVRCGQKLDGRLVGRLCTAPFRTFAACLCVGVAAVSDSAKARKASAGEAGGARCGDSRSQDLLPKNATLTESSANSRPSVDLLLPARCGSGKASAPRVAAAAAAALGLSSASFVASISPRRRRRRQQQHTPAARTSPLLRRGSSVIADGRSALPDHRPSRLPSALLGCRTKRLPTTAAFRPDLP